MIIRQITQAINRKINKHFNKTLKLLITCSCLLMPNAAANLKKNYNNKMIKTCQQSDRVFTVTVTLARTCPLQLITLYKYKRVGFNIMQYQIMKNGGVKYFLDK